MRNKLSALLMSRESHCEQNDQIQCAHLNILSKTWIMTVEKVISTTIIVHIYVNKHNMMKSNVRILRQKSSSLILTSTLAIKTKFSDNKS